MGVEGLDYDELLKKYRELQLRVTRFSATEQALINTRDRLDQELEIYKRMQRYNAMLLSIPSNDRFFNLVSEGIVDVFELESAVVAQRTSNNDDWHVFSEGLKIEDYKSLKGDLQTLTQLHASGVSQLLKLDDLSFIQSLS